MEITFFYFISAVHVFEADVVPRISALTRSCVVIPCTFDIGSEPVTRLRGLWYDTNGDYVYHTGQTNVMDNFKGRTELLGEPDEKNCTLEIDDVKAHDNGPFCFHAEKGNDKYSCICYFPDKPVISGLPEEMEPGKKFSLSCSVTHTCPSHPPTIKWSIKTAKEVVSHMEGSAGQWKTTSTVTFIPTGYENEDDLLCSASFWRGKKQETAIYLPITIDPPLALITSTKCSCSCRSDLHNGQEEFWTIFPHKTVQFSNILGISGVNNYPKVMPQFFKMSES
uniref:Si:dkey-238d18.9 n=1 Tax=Astyanax mexicanus TaxID=7994 RepID=A0A8B9KCY3_ASTMX